MASHTVEVIQVQPQVQSPSSALSSQAQLDKQIIKKINLSTELMSKQSFNYFSLRLDVLTRYLGSCYPSTSDSCVSCTCKCCSLPQWYVCLTSTHVHIVHNSGTGTVFEKYKIALTDIVEIKTVSHVVNAGYCGLGTQIASPMIMIMELKPSGAKVFFPICCKWCNLPCVIPFIAMKIQPSS